MQYSLNFDKIFSELETAKIELDANNNIGFARSKLDYCLVLLEIVQDDKELSSKLIDYTIYFTSKLKEAFGNSENFLNEIFRRLNEIFAVTHDTESIDQDTKLYFNIAMLVFYQIAKKANPKVAEKFYNLGFDLYTDKFDLEYAHDYFDNYDVTVTLHGKNASNCD